MRESTRSGSAAAMVLCLLAAIAGCRDDGGIIVPRHVPPPSYLPRTSPENLLHNFKSAYHERNLTEYDSLLSTDFVFVLSPRDQQIGGMPHDWGRDVELLATSRMFDREFVQVLSLDFQVGQPDSAGSLRIDQVDFYLYGSTVAHPTEIKEYKVSQGRSRFRFHRNSWTTGAAHDSVWTIVRWEDDPTPARPSEGGWGAIKAAFR